MPANVCLGPRMIWKVSSVFGEVGWDCPLGGPLARTRASKIHAENAQQAPHVWQGAESFDRNFRFEAAPTRMVDQKSRPRRVLPTLPCTVAPKDAKAGNAMGFRTDQIVLAVSIMATSLAVRPCRRKSSAMTSASRACAIGGCTTVITHPRGYSKWDKTLGT